MFRCRERTRQFPSCGRKLLLQRFEKLCKLVRAGCRFTAAKNPTESGCGILYVHSTDKRSNSLQVAVAAVLEMYILNSVSIEFKFNKTGADSLGYSDDFALGPVVCF